MENFEEKIESSPILVENAGLVLLCNFIPIYFQKIGLLKENCFIDKQKQAYGVVLLEFLATGNTEIENKDLTLHKILCGIDSSFQINLEAMFKKEHKEISEDFLNAIIMHWQILKNTSLEEFRSSWLQRKGVLTNSKNLELKVEKKGYDILLSRSPFSYNFIKLSWMPIPLYVNWFN